MRHPAHLFRQAAPENIACQHLVQGIVLVTQCWGQHELVQQAAGEVTGWSYQLSPMTTQTMRTLDCLTAAGTLMPQPETSSPPQLSAVVQLAFFPTVTPGFPHHHYHLFSRWTWVGQLSLVFFVQLFQSRTFRKIGVFLCQGSSNQQCQLKETESTDPRELPTDDNPFFIHHRTPEFSLYAGCPMPVNPKWIRKEWRFSQARCPSCHQPTAS